MRFSEYLSKGVIIRSTTLPSRKCDLMKLSVPFISSIYDVPNAPKCWNSHPDELRIISYFSTFKYRIYSYMLSL